MDLQARAGNAAVVQLLRQVSVQRDPPTAPPVADDAQKALAEQLEVIREQIAANEEDDPKEAARQERALLLAQFTHPDPFPSRDAVMEFIARCDKDADKEAVTLTKLGKDAAQAVIQHPQAFPETWADQLAKTLDLGIDDATLTGERTRSWSYLTEVGNRVPAGVTEYGLPVSLAEIRALKKYVLKPEQAKLPEADVLRDFAQAALTYRGSAMKAEMVRWWKRVLANLVENVRSGTETIDPAEVAIITKTRGKFWEFVNSQMAPGEDQFRELDAEVVQLQELAMLTAILSVVAGLQASGKLWTEASDLLAAKLVEADGIVAGWGVGDTLKHAFLWMIDRGYVGDQLLLMVHVLVDNIGDVLKEMALFMGLQAIPVVDVLVDAYLIWKLGSDLVSALWDLGKAFTNAATAKTVISLQQSSADLVSALATAPLRIVLDYFGLSATLAHLESRVARLLAENPAMTPREAAKIAVREPESTATSEPATTPTTEPTTTPKTEPTTTPKTEPTTTPKTEPSTGDTSKPGKSKSGKEQECFIAGTLVLTDQGLRPIETLIDGDLIVATDPDSGRAELCPVAAVTSHPDRLLVSLGLGGGTIECTAAHPFWVDGRGWLEAGQIEPGMSLRGADGNALVVTETGGTGRRGTVHNLTVDGLHTYHVGDQGVLVHNKPMKARELPKALSAARNALEQRVKGLRTRSARIGEQATEIPMNRPERADLKRRWDELHERLETLQDDIHDTKKTSQVNGLRKQSNRAEVELDALQAEVNAAWVPKPTAEEVAAIDLYTQELGDLRAALDAGNANAQARSRAVLDQIERRARMSHNQPNSHTSRLQDHVESLMNQRSLMDTPGAALPVFGRRLPCQATQAAGGGLRGLNYYDLEARLGIPIRDPRSAPIGKEGGVRFVWRFLDESEIAIDIPASSNESAWQISREPHAAITAPPPNKGVHLSQEGIAVPDMSAPAHMPMVKDRLLNARIRGDTRPAKDILR